VTIPERKGAFIEFCEVLGNRMVTEFNYRYSSEDKAALLVSVRLSDGDRELTQIMMELEQSGYPVANMTDNDLAKSHVRYLVGGRPPKALNERLYSFRFPEQPGALMRFLHTLGTYRNISLFHYRNHGAEFGRVLCAFELPDQDLASFERHLAELGYRWDEVTQDPAYQFFLAH
ncbi:MAG: threonine ammonia-lyase, biosynthetic, partial [Oceanisphaera sp.]|nr:threonine ammonia-lyase, biosynthetic [Oceanisphaera sp.]